MRADMYRLRPLLCAVVALVARGAQNRTRFREDVDDAVFATLDDDFFHPGRGRAELNITVVVSDKRLAPEHTQHLPLCNVSCDDIWKESASARSPPPPCSFLVVRESQENKRVPPGLCVRARPRLELRPSVFPDQIGLSHGAKLPRVRRTASHRTLRVDTRASRCARAGLPTPRLVPGRGSASVAHAASSSDEFGMTVLLTGAVPPSGVRGDSVSLAR